MAVKYLIIIFTHMGNPTQIIFINEISLIQVLYILKTVNIAISKSWGENESCFHSLKWKMPKQTFLQFLYVCAGVWRSVRVMDT